MITMAQLHSLTSELHTGMIVLAFVCIMIVAGSQLIIGFRKVHGKPGVFYRIAVNIRGYAEPTGIFAAILGVIIVVLSAFTGMFAWPVDDALSTPVVRNKILLTIFALTAWILVISIRLRFGRRLWTCPALAMVYTGITALAFGFTSLSGCLGAHVTLGESLLDPIWAALGWDVDVAMALNPEIYILLGISGAIALPLMIIFARKNNLLKQNLSPDTCQRVIKWTEPVIRLDQSSLLMMMEQSMITSDEKDKD